MGGKKGSVWGPATAEKPGTKVGRFTIESLSDERVTYNRGQRPKPNVLRVYLCRCECGAMAPVTSAMINAIRTRCPNHAGCRACISKALSKQRLERSATKRGKR